MSKLTPHDAFLCGTSDMVSRLPRRDVTVAIGERIKDAGDFGIAGSQTIGVPLDAGDDVPNERVINGLPPEQGGYDGGSDDAGDVSGPIFIGEFDSVIHVDTQTLRAILMLPGVRLLHGRPQSSMPRPSREGEGV